MVFGYISGKSTNRMENSLLLHIFLCMIVATYTEAGDTSTELSRPNQPDTQPIAGELESIASFKDKIKTTQATKTDRHRRLDGFFDLPSIPEAVSVDRKKKFGDILNLGSAWSGDTTHTSIRHGGRQMAAPPAGHSHHHEMSPLEDYYDDYDEIHDDYQHQEPKAVEIGRKKDVTVKASTDGYTSTTSYDVNKKSDKLSQGAEGSDPRCATQGAERKYPWCTGQGAQSEGAKSSSHFSSALVLMSAAIMMIHRKLIDL